MVSPTLCVAMDEQRAQAYLSLIQELLDCLSKENPEPVLLGQILKRLSSLGFIHQHSEEASGPLFSEGIV
ncbi:hypothetical protein [Laspinema olomoucense]|uniref:Uncharacterized protein n=1 Tax=Laspinema olomoucense D3b TaxID=2953688 RepID=A0ABT2N5W5_9CYAN|nr:hypothetical protein [Laspinema sp. D3b]MCT7976760.1 hypothetical protein [Laspinema sp. D3b]